MELKYMRPELEDKYGFLELQDRILGIAVYLDKRKLRSLRRKQRKPGVEVSASIYG